MIRLLILIIGLAGAAFGESITKGYQNRFYTLNPDQSTFCQYNHKYQEDWCLTIQPQSLGFYVGFNQAVIYSGERMQAIDLIRQQAKWSIELHDVHKLHINYPVMVVSKLDNRVYGYDYFSGFSLWERSISDYKNMFETKSDVWLYTDQLLSRMDVITGDSSIQIPIDFTVQQVMGDDTYLFIQSPENTYFYHLVSKTLTPIGNQYKLKSASSTLVLMGNDSQSELRSFSNQVVSYNVRHDLVPLYSPTVTQFSVRNSNELMLISDRSNVVYELSPTENTSMITYSYKLKNQLFGFHKTGQQIWTLTRKNKPSFVLDI